MIKLSNGKYDCFDDINCNDVALQNCAMFIEGHGCKGGAVLECCLAEFGHGSGNLNTRDSRAVFECAFGNCGKRSGQGQILKRGAVVECLDTKVGQAVGKHGGGESDTTLEGALADVGQFLTEADVGQLGTATESVLFDLIKLCIRTDNSLYGFVKPLVNLNGSCVFFHIDFGYNAVKDTELEDKIAFLVFY